jgi:hypothetical protein
VPADFRNDLRASFARGHELVYDDYNALMFGFSPTDRTSEAFISVAGWVTLFTTVKSASAKQRPRR